MTRFLFMYLKLSRRVGGVMWRRFCAYDAAAPAYDALAERFGFDGEAGASFFLAAPAADDFM